MQDVVRLCLAPTIMGRNNPTANTSSRFLPQGKQQEDHEEEDPEASGKAGEEEEDEEEDEEDRAYADACRAVGAEVLESFRAEGFEVCSDGCNGIPYL